MNEISNMKFALLSKDSNRFEQSLSEYIEKLQNDRKKFHEIVEKPDQEVANTISQLAQHEEAFDLDNAGEDIERFNFKVLQQNNELKQKLVESNKRRQAVGSSEVFSEQLLAMRQEICHIKQQLQAFRSSEAQDRKQNLDTIEQFVNGNEQFSRALLQSLASARQSIAFLAALLREFMSAQCVQLELAQCAFQRFYGSLEALRKMAAPVREAVAEVGASVQRLRGQVRSDAAGISGQLMGIISCRPAAGAHRERNQATGSAIIQELRVVRGQLLHCRQQIASVAGQGSSSAAIAVLQSLSRYASDLAAAGAPLRALRQELVAMHSEAAHSIDSAIFAFSAYKQARTNYAPVLTYLRGFALEEPKIPRISGIVRQLAKINQTVQAVQRRKDGLVTVAACCAQLSESVSGEKAAILAELKQQYERHCHAAVYAHLRLILAQQQDIRSLRALVLRGQEQFDLGLRRLELGMPCFSSSRYEQQYRQIGWYIGQTNEEMPGEVLKILKVLAEFAQIAVTVVLEVARRAAELSLRLSRVDAQISQFLACGDIERATNEQGHGRAVSCCAAERCDFAAQTDATAPMASVEIYSLEDYSDALQFTEFYAEPHKEPDNIIYAPEELDATRIDTLRELKSKRSLRHSSLELFVAAHGQIDALFRGELLRELCVVFNVEYAETTSFACAFRNFIISKYNAAMERYLQEFIEEIFLSLATKYCGALKQEEQNLYFVLFEIILELVLYGYQLGEFSATPGKVLVFPQLTGDNYVIAALQVRQDELK